MAFRDFDAALAEALGEPLTFQLGGERFDVPLPLPAAPWIRAVSDPKRDVTVAFHGYLREVIAEDQRETFDEAFEQAKVPEATLIEIVKWITEEASGFPTKRRSSSSRSPRTNGKRSNNASISAVK